MVKKLAILTDNDHYLITELIKLILLIFSDRLKFKISCFSKREFDILMLVVEEYSSKRISELSFISSGIVETHKKNILNKFGVNDGFGFISLFVESNLFNSIEGS